MQGAGLGVGFFVVTLGKRGGPVGLTWSCARRSSLSLTPSRLAYKSKGGDRTASLRAMMNKLSSHTTPANYQPGKTICTGTHTDTQQDNS